jgi:hypothetical protein
VLAFQLPSWIERLLGVDPAETGEGTQWGYDLSWNLPAWATLLLLVATVCYVGYFYFRERQAAGSRAALAMGTLRLLAIGLVFFMIAELVLTRARTGLPYVVVLLDVSQSMDTEDRYDPASLVAELDDRVKGAGLDRLTRLNLAKTLVLEDDGTLLRSIAQRYKLKLYFVADTVRHRPGDPDELLKEIKELDKGTGDASLLGTGVQSALNDLRGTPPSAVVILTDGITTAGPTLSEAAVYARRKNVPLYTVALGSEQPVKNLKLSELLVDEVVFVNDVVNFEFQLTSAGFAGRQVEVSLREKDKTEKLACSTVTLPPDNTPLKVRLPYRPTQKGEYEYVVEVERLAEETNTDDNTLLPRKVRVREEQIHVLLVQSYPSHEFRFLKTMLERDSSVQLKTVLQEADQGYAQIDKTALRSFPVRRDELHESFDVVIFGDVNPSFLSNSVMDNLATFVTQRGKAIVFIAGQRHTPLDYRHTPLAALFPIDLGSAVAPDPQLSIRDDFVVQPTPLGLASPHMQLGDSLPETERLWRDMNGVYWMLEAHNLKPAARVLAEHPTRFGRNGRKLPVFIEQYVGAGRVLFHTIDETYRWRYRLGDVLLRRYWVQTLRYLSRSKLLGENRSVELTIDRQKYERGDAVRFRVRFRDERQAPLEDDGVTVMLDRDGHKGQSIKLHRNSGDAHRGVFEGELSNAPVGHYHAWVAEPSLPTPPTGVDFSVEQPPGEFERLQLDVAELKQAASLSKGKYYTFLTAHRLLDELPEGRQVVLESLQPFVVWNWYPLPLAVIVLLVCEWIMRKRMGLL